MSAAATRKVAAPKPPPRDPPLPKSVRAKDFKRVLGIHEKTPYKLMKSDPTFPRPRRISMRVVVWDLDELLAWRDSKGYSATAGGA